MSVTAFLKVHRCPACGRPIALDQRPAPATGPFATMPAIFGVCGMANTHGCAHIVVTEFTGDGRPRNMNAAEKAWLQANPEALAFLKECHEATILRLGLIG